MEISATIAQEIVSQMKIVLSQEINFMNSQAIIIASTDSSRIGNFHGGAETVLKTRQPLVIECDNQFTGSKKGINMPITFEKEVIGVIGITGEKEQVMKNGEIIKKMTEILIKEDFLKNITLQKRNQSWYIIEKLLTYHTAPSSFEESDVFNYDYSRPHISAVGQLDWEGSFRYEDLYTLLDQEFFHTSRYKYTIINNQLFLLIQDSNAQAVSKTLDSLGKKISSAFKTPFYFGVSALSFSEDEARQAFQHARDALSWNISYDKKGMLDYSDMDLGLLYFHLSKKNKKPFIDKILSGIPETEYVELRKVLLTYGEFNKSLSRSAEHLFIHKNSFQYKLNKIYTYTGYDPKVLNDYVRLYLAFLLNDK